MRTRWLIVIAALGLVSGLIARFPLSAALALGGARGAGLEWTAAEGPVWSGAVRGLRLNTYPLGDAQVALSPLSLLTLSPAADVRLAGPEAVLQGRLGVRLGGALRISGANATLYLSEMSAIDPRLRARGGALVAQDVNVTLRDGRCAAASGTLASDALAYGFGGGWRGPALAGAVSCENGRLVLALSGADEGQSVEAAAHLGPGAWWFEAQVRSNDRELAQVAPLLGFTPYGEGWRYRAEFAP